jgi:hypothetical protein
VPHFGPFDVFYKAPGQAPGFEFANPGPEKNTTVDLSSFSLQVWMP